MRKGLPQAISKTLLRAESTEFHGKNRGVRFGRSHIHGIRARIAAGSVQRHPVTSAGFCRILNLDHVPPSVGLPAVAVGEAIDSGEPCVAFRSTLDLRMVSSSQRSAVSQTHGRTRTKLRFFDDALVGRLRNPERPAARGLELT